MTDCVHHWDCEQDGHSVCRKCGEERHFFPSFDGWLDSIRRTQGYAAMRTILNTMTANAAKCG